MFGLLLILVDHWGKSCRPPQVQMLDSDTYEHSAQTDSGLNGCSHYVLGKRILFVFIDSTSILFSFFVSFHFTTTSIFLSHNLVSFCCLFSLSWRMGWFVYRWGDIISLKGLLLIWRLGAWERMIHMINDGLSWGIDLFVCEHRPISRDEHEGVNSWSCWLWAHLQN